MARILVVEDAAEMRMLLTATLQTAGHDVIEASDGETVMDKALGAAPDLVLLDILMPQLDGWDALARLKSHNRTKNIPVIIVSSLGTDNDLDEARQLGAFDYVTKPWSPSELLERVRWALVSARKTAA